MSLRCLEVSSAITGHPYSVNSHVTFLLRMKHVCFSLVFLETFADHTYRRLKVRALNPAEMLPLSSLEFVCWWVSRGSIQGMPSSSGDLKLLGEPEHLTYIIAAEGSDAIFFLMVSRNTLTPCCCL